jgi:uncharacterized YigZ family protein
MATIQYLVPNGTAHWEQEMKKSRFIAAISRASSPEEAKAWVSKQRALHVNARHHCWAFVAGSPQDSQCLGFSDDGEPSSTAGKPILAQLQGSGLGEICAVVIRYSGGVKLGTGGLVRAYGTTTKEALGLLPVELYIPQRYLKLSFDFNLLGIIERAISHYRCVKISAEFGEFAELTVSLDEQCAQVFSTTVNDQCSGKITIKQVNP